MRALLVDDRVREFIGDMQFAEPLPDDLKIINVPDNVRVGWVYKDGKFTPPAGPHQNLINGQLASNALVASDVVIARCYESKVDVPQDWVYYRTMLRKIAAQTHSTDAPQIVVPQPPPLPSGLK